MAPRAIKDMDFREPLSTKFAEHPFHALVTRLLTGLDCPFVVWRPSELREALERRADELSAMARRQETGHSW